MDQEPFGIFPKILANSTGKVPKFVREMQGVYELVEKVSGIGPTEMPQGRAIC